ncbi:MAG: hypothetical protein D6816_14325 [Bacteroidetes bacterium]|nr:hypothetical protein [Saprospirales bacterium]RMD99909.1 MAG: hypothetical protein D6816_14325 [Bacteroidota bacterium]
MAKDERTSGKKKLEEKKEKIKSALRNVKIGVTTRGRIVTNLDHEAINEFLEKKMEQEEE